MTQDNILEDMKAEVTRSKRPRTFAGGLLPAFCDFFLELDHPANGYASLEDFYARNPPVTEGANTLSVLPEGSSKKKTIRPAYNATERFYIYDEGRVGYPSMAPHATGQWHDYQRWLEHLATFTPQQLVDLRERAKSFMLSHLKENKFDPSTVIIEPPIFRMLIEQFPWTERRGQEKTGAAFQAMVFAFIRADSPHLQVEARRVRTGSARVQGIGDIDAWEGRKLTISAEVKHYVFGEEDLKNIKKFVDQVLERGALGMIVATGFSEGVATLVEEAGIRPITVQDLSRIVSLWDPVKQRAALNAFEWAVFQKELSLDLGERLDEFLVQVGFRLERPKDENPAV